MTCDLPHSSAADIRHPPSDIRHSPAADIRHPPSDIRHSPAADIRHPPSDILHSPISLIIPTLNEAANLAELARRVHQSLDGRQYELLIVDDDSTDDTPAVCAALAKTYPLRLITRKNPKDGLGGAVLAGLREATGDVLVVMDADLQHPPEKLPELVGPLDRGEADFVIGSRYVAGASTQEQWGWFRKINSRAATWLARPFAGKVADPMSGFFALSRQTFDRGTALTPLGYKIGLELMCKCQVQRPAEIPINFATRQHGQSKLSIKEQFRYLEHLSRLYDFCYPRLSPILKFLIVVTAGWASGFALFYTAQIAGLSSIGSTLVGYLWAILLTAAFHLRYVRTQREFIHHQRPWVSFGVIAAIELLSTVIAACWLAWRTPEITALEFWTIAYSAGVIARYILRKELLADLRGLGGDISARRRHGAS